VVGLFFAFLTGLGDGYKIEIMVNANGELIKKIILILISFLIITGFSSCGPSVSPQDKLIVAYEKYVDDIIAEYKKIDAGDFEAYNNIAPLSEKSAEIKEQLRDFILNDEQRAKLEKINEKRMDFFNNR